MNCETAKNLIQPYLEGRLPTLERNEFVYHVTECGACETEVLAYRQVFRSLRSMERFEAPSRVQVAVLAHLHAEGLIHEPRFPMFKRVLDAFLDLPARVRYPLAALAAVMVMYLPVGFVLAGARGSLAGAAETLARGVLWFQGVFEGVSARANVEPYTRAARTVTHAAAEVALPIAVMLLVAALVAVVALTAARIVRRKKPSGHALFTF
ncbi:MAG TPA: zf-HC2 domain-containing protein [Candidatus Krumholzibacteria bacterium]|nr:zf-HC2 domain-containing protein [Candidatus Krumholzibacteria bacterium]